MDPNGISLLNGGAISRFARSEGYEPTGVSNASSCRQGRSSRPPVLGRPRADDSPSWGRLQLEEGEELRTAAGGGGTVTVKVAPLSKTLTAVGSLSSPQQTVVTSQIDGKVASLNIRQGKVVTRGERCLATLDDSVQQAAVQTAEAELFNARQIYERDQQVKDTGGLSEQQLQSDEARCAGPRPS